MINAVGLNEPSTVSQCPDGAPQPENGQGFESILESCSGREAQGAKDTSEKTDAKPEKEGQDTLLAEMLAACVSGRAAIPADVPAQDNQGNAEGGAVLGQAVTDGSFIPATKPGAEDAAVQAMGVVMPDVQAVPGIAACVLEKALVLPGEKAPYAKGDMKTDKDGSGDVKDVGRPLAPVAENSQKAIKPDAGAMQAVDKTAASAADAASRTPVMHEFQPFTGMKPQAAGQPRKPDRVQSAESVAIQAGPRAVTAGNAVPTVVAVGKAAGRAGDEDNRGGRPEDDGAVSGGQQAVPGAAAALKEAASMQAARPAAMPVLNSAGVVTGLQATDKAGHAQASKGGIIDQVVSGMGSMLKRGDDGVVIRLHPPSLGSIKVEITTKEHEVRAALVADSAAVRDILAGAQSELKAALGEAGLALQEFSVSVGGGDGRGWSGQAQEPGGGHAAVSNEDEAQPSPRPGTTGRESGLDLFV